MEEKVVEVEKMCLELFETENILALYNLAKVVMPERLRQKGG